MTHRKSEQDSVHFRSDRVFVVNNQWFLQVRELEAPIGPFFSREAADKAAKTFAADIKSGLSALQARSHLKSLANLALDDDS